VTARVRALLSFPMWARSGPDASRQWTRAGILALSILVCAITLSRHAWTASGADPSGYVSQADLWRHGSLIVPQPLASDAPWGDREWPLAPLGYRPALTPGAIVPTYPAGLPLTLAAAQLVGGRNAAYVVVPLVAGLGIWVTFLLGRQAGGNAVGAVAALLLACCPIYLRQATQVMSDVPAAVWWTLALVLAQRRAAFAAGLAASLAIATRPNLAPLGLAIALATVLAERGERRDASSPALRSTWIGQVRRLGALAVGALPGLVLIGVVHTYLYGSPLRSGYGDNADLYAVSNIPQNARLYTAWLLEGQTAMLLLALGALVFRQPAAPLLPFTPTARRADSDASQWPLWLLAALVIACYLPYAVFEDWWYIRFLLPAFPAVFVLMARGLVFASQRLPRNLGRVALVASTAVLLTISVARIRASQSLELARDERRYALMTDILREAVPAASAFISLQHSGSIHHYLDRPIVRWELVPPDRLDASIEYLRAKGYHPYILLDSWEAPRFRDRFAHASPIGHLDWPPVLELRSPTPVRLFDPADRARYFAGTRIPTRLVFPPRH
jgi:hypothetical protein